MTYYSVPDDSGSWAVGERPVTISFEPSPAALSAMVNSIPGGGLGAAPAFRAWWLAPDLVEDWFGMWQMGGPL
jgi:hypothetical protein